MGYTCSSEYVTAPSCCVGPASTAPPGARISPRVFLGRRAGSLPLWPLQPGPSSECCVRIDLTSYQAGFTLLHRFRPLTASCERWKQKSRFCWRFLEASSRIREDGQLQRLLRLPMGAQVVFLSNGPLPNLLGSVR